MLIEDFYGNDVKYFLGVVEDRNDPLGANRVRVRIFGVHSLEQSKLSTGDLPWCLVLMPNTSAGISGIGSSPHALVEGSWVFGIFLDGDDKQQALVVGNILGNSKISRNDPIGIVNSSGSYTADTAYDGGSVPPINVPGNENRERIYNFFIQNGYTPEQSAGIVGNMMGEAGVSLNPDTHQNGGNGYGLAQWDNRKQNLFDWCRSHGYDHSSLEAQLLFTMHELNSTEGKANSLLKATNTPESAALAFCSFERPYFYKKIGGSWKCDPNNGDMQKRMGYARDTYNKYGKRTSSPESTTTVNEIASINKQFNIKPNSNIINSQDFLLADLNKTEIKTLQIISTNTHRDVTVNVTDLNSEISYIIRKNGSLEKIAGSNSILSIALDGGNSGYYNSISSSNGIGTSYYSLAQRNTLATIIRLLKTSNSNLEIYGINLDFDPNTLVT